MTITTVTRTICSKHNFRATVGSNVAYALDEYECPTCVAEQDAAHELSFQPCCSAANTTCCGHDGEEPTTWSADEKLHWSMAFPSRSDYRYNTPGKFDSLTGLIVDSSNYCDGHVPF